MLISPFMNRSLVDFFRETSLPISIPGVLMRFETFVVGFDAQLRRVGRKDWIGGSGCWPPKDLGGFWIGFGFGIKV